MLSLPFLTSRGVSPLLAASLIHAAVEEVLQTELTEFKQQSVETEGEGDEERFTCKYPFFFCGFRRCCLLEDFSVLKCFPEYLVMLSGKQQWTELYLLLLGICGMKGSYASFVGKMQMWYVELWTDCVGWLFGKGRELLFPKMIDNCVHCASWTELAKNFS